MGFCLFRESEPDGFYFAVNPAHVGEFAQVDERGAPACLLKFPFSTGDFVPLAMGARDDVRKTMMAAAKIGLGKIEAQILTGQKKQKAAALLLNNPNRIALVRELRADEFGAFKEDHPTASQVFFIDGTERIIAGRPGTFALKVNAGARVPVL